MVFTVTTEGFLWPVKGLHRLCHCQESDEPRHHLPFEEEQVGVVVLLGEEVAQDPVGVAAADLVGRQTEVDTLDKVPQLGRGVVSE